MSIRSISVVLFLYICSFVYGQDEPQQASKPIDTTTYVYGNVMYEKGNYPVAISVYENLLNANGPAEQVYYNLGNAYYKTNQFGKAILNYERALFFDSNNRDAEYNLSLANERIRDKIEPVATSIFTLWWRSYVNWFSATGWSVIAVICIWMALLGFVLYRYHKFIRYQRQGFYIFLITMVFFVFAFAGAAGRNALDKQYQFAIVTAQSAVVKSEPAESSTNLFLIHEGLKLQMLQTESEWTEIKMPDGEIGWIQNKDIIPVNPFIAAQNWKLP